jgi:flagellar motor switch protein FliN/FliY
MARSLGLGDEVAIGQEWSADDGDMVLGVRLSGGATGMLVLAVNDGVGERLLSDPAVLQAAFAAGVQAAGGKLHVTFEASTVERITDHVPLAVIEITDAGVLTSLAGITLPLSSPVVDDVHPVEEFEPISFEDTFDVLDHHPATAALSVLNDVELVVTAELGRTTMAVRELLGLSPGMVVEIDRAAGAPIDLLVNGRRIAAGEVVVIDEEFGIRITDIAPIGDRRR